MIKTKAITRRMVNLRYGNLDNLFRTTLLFRWYGVALDASRLRLLY